MTVLTFSIFFASKGQEKGIVPPSPNAAALGQYGDFPVSNYTGVPSISIPLHTIRSGKIEMPISLSYHASGIKVAQEASWVGLGWTLNAGGVITRQKIGLDDFDLGEGYTTAPAVLTAGINSYDFDSTIDGFYPVGAEDTYAQCQRYLAGVEDGEPDIFYFNFFGYNGRMFFRKNQGNTVFEGTTIEQTNLKFRYIVATEKFEVTDANGWKYYFGTTEITRALGQTQSLTPITSRPNASQSQDLISAWYLDKVETPEGDEISFIYGRTGRWIEGQNVSEHTVNFWRNDLHVNNKPGFIFSSRDQSSGTGEAAYTYFYYSASSTITDEVYLKRINFKNGYAIFDTGDRADRLTYQAGTPSQYLKSIELRHSNDVLFKKITLNQSYFRSDKITALDKEKFLRLRLNSVQECLAKADGTLACLPSYNFNYNAISLPDKTSFSVDRWGFYNGADNSAVLPHKYVDISMGTTQPVHQQVTIPIPMLTARFSVIDENVRIFIYGADREPHSTNVKAGILTGIEYPTGGVTTFTYEPNDFFSELEPQFNETGEYAHSVTSHGTTEKLFTLTQTAVVFLNFSLTNHMYANDPTATGIMDNMTAVLEKVDGTDILKFIPSDSQMDGVPGGNNNVDNMEANVCVVLEPGSYRIKTLHGGYTYLSLSLSAKYREKVLTKKKLGAGVRIKAIENYDIGGLPQLKRKRFVYEKNGESTGRLLQKFQPFVNSTDMMYKIMGTPTRLYQPCCDINSVINPVNIHPGIPYAFQMSESLKVPFGTSLQGNTVGYNEVSVLDEDWTGQNLGRTTYKYKNMTENYLGAFIPGMPTRRVLDNGQLTLEEFYNDENILVKKRSHHYSRSEETAMTLPGMHTSFRPVGAYATPGFPYTFGGDDVPYVGVYYELWSEWWYPTETIETIYNVDGSNPITTTTTYEYGNASHKLPTKTTQITSVGRLLSTATQYVQDNPSGTQTSSATLSQMINANIISPAIKQEVKLDGNLISGSINNYTIDTHGNAVASTVQELKTDDATYETKTEFQLYDDMGKILQIKDRGDIVTSYFWTNNNEFPVVKAQNVDYNTLKSAIESAAGTTDLDGFWSNFFQVSSNNTSWNNFNIALRNIPTLKNALVTTYTYMPQTGMTSATDPNGRTSYYEYDDLKRLKCIRNPDGEILQNYKYVYAND